MRDYSDKAMMKRLDNVGPVEAVNRWIIDRPQHRRLPYLISILVCLVSVVAILAYINPAPRPAAASQVKAVQFNPCFSCHVPRYNPYKGYRAYKKAHPSTPAQDKRLLAEMEAAR